MLNIDAELFKKNLLLTQLYCEIQMSNMIEDGIITDVASVFRSFNPEIEETEIYEYGVEEYRATNTIGSRLVKTVRWTLPPNSTGSESIIEGLFSDQLAYKEKCLKGLPLDKHYEGDIFITQVDFSVFDGASAGNSYFLYDEFDLPPIDTWFYFLTKADTRLIFAWIPDKYCELADDAIAVNCTDCINTFKTLYEPEYKKYYKWNLSHLPLKVIV
jgi:hypothetical protein